jgi:hypothetical protein
VIGLSFLTQFLSSFFYFGGVAAKKSLFSSSLPISQGFFKGKGLEDSVLTTFFTSSL